MALWRVPLLLALCTVYRTQIVPVEEACKYLPCHEDTANRLRGKPVFKDGNCFCLCEEGYTGPLCELKIATSDWPQGPYATPMSVYGCPEEYAEKPGYIYDAWETRGWNTGYLNMSFTESLSQHMGSVSESVTDPRTISLLGPYDDYHVQMNFCLKTKNTMFIPTNGSQWPGGSYRIYRAGGACPYGFQENVIRAELPLLLHYNMDGDLPDIELQPGNQSTSLLFHVCDKQDIFSNSTGLSNLSAVILMKDNSKDVNECPVFPGLLCKEEELFVISLEYCAYMPFHEDIAMDKMVERDDLYAQLYVLDRDFTISVHDPFQAYQLSAENYQNASSYDKQEIAWIRLDLHHTRRFKGIVIKTPNVDLSKHHLTQRDLPVAFCNSQKWSFLHNGGIKTLNCTWSVTWIEGQYYVFLPCVWQCRYLALVAGNRLKSNIDLLTNILHSPEILIDSIDTIRDESDLGMTDGRVDDFQISASSNTPDRPPHHARPQLKGWCPQAGDSEPFLQVDLLAPTKINGIRIYNWYSTADYTINNTFKSELRLEGTESFFVKYGFTRQTLKNYTKWDGSNKFYVDKSLPYTVAQTFMFRNTVLGSLIQIYPKVMSQRLVCMRLELIGRSQTVMKTVSCNGKNDTFWVAREQLFVPSQSPYADSVLVTSDIQECKDVCRANQTNCTAIMFKHETTTCTQFASPARYSYSTRKAEMGTSMYQLVCLEYYPTKYFSYRSNVSKGIVASPGYPEGPIGANYSRSIKFRQDSAESVLLIFTNISVTEYKFQGQPGQSTDDCQEKLTISGYPVLNESSFPVDGQMIVPVAKAEVHFITETCLRKDGAHVINFRMLYNVTDYPWCISAASWQEDLCDFEQSWGVVASNSFLGLSHRNMRHEFWSIRAYYKHIRLKIEEMFISCNSGSVLEVKYSNNTRLRLCNGRREIGHILSLNMELSLYFRRNSESNFTEGFVAQYSKQPYSHFITKTMIKKKASLRLARGEKYWGRLEILDNRYSPKWQPLGTDARRMSTVAKVVCRQLGLSGGSARSTWPRTRKYSMIPLRCTGSELNLFDCSYKRIAYSRQKGISVVCKQQPIDHVKICRPVNRKCYYVFRNINFNTNEGLTAAESDDYCSLTFGHYASLVHIADEDEELYLKSSILFMMVNVTAVKPAVSEMGYIYIGLIRYHKGGELEEKWTSGQPVSYSSWKTGHPGEGLTQGGCTRMAITASAGVSSWEAISCAGINADYFVCETKFPNKDDERNLHHNRIVKNIQKKGIKYQNFKCGTKEFISNLFRCDGLNDCLDGSDEDDCQLSNWHGHCGEGYFQCLDGECIPISACCDYVLDCKDASDEYCDFSTCNDETEYKCDNNQCIEGNLRCDTVINCLDGSDEKNCVTCPEEKFQCWDKQITCLPPEKVCDGFVDCYDESDEKNCEVTCLGSCREWWLKGYRQSGEYCVENIKVECNFESDGTIKTIYHDIEGNQHTAHERDGIGVRYGSLEFVQKLVTELSCTQSIKKECRPPASIIATAEGLGNSQVYWDCICVRWIIDDRHNKKPEPCSEETIKEVATRGNEWMEEVALKIKQLRGFPITNIQFDTSPTPIETLTFEHITCVEAFNETDYADIVCKRGNVVSSENRCLYQVHGNGYIKGCADMTHLQNCDDFECPSGFVKCPRSYCIPLHFLCDGMRQCPYGNDEINCWCGKTSSQVTIIFESNDELLYNAMIAMATHLHQIEEHGSNVRLLMYFPSTKGENKTQADLPHFGNLTAEIRYFNSLKYEQLKEPYFSGSIQKAFQYALEEGNNSHEESSMKLLLVNQDTLFSGKFQEWMDVNRTIAELFVVFVGKQEGDFVLGDVISEKFPKGTSYVHVEDASHPGTFAFEQLSGVCPVPDSPVCDGLYRCHASRMCLELSSVCDGIPHCPLRDDERLCSFRCPDECECLGYSVNCSNHRVTPDTLTVLPNATRRLNLDNNILQDTSDDTSLHFMVALTMSRCGLRNIPKRFITEMRNLMFLDLSFNEIEIIRTGDLANKAKLVHINLEGNTRLKIIQQRAFEKLVHVNSLIIRETGVEVIEPWTFSDMDLDLLELSKNKLSLIKAHAFGNLRAIALNISENKILKFPRNMLTDIAGLQSVVTDAYTFCCIKPDSVKEENCKPERDEFSSCEDLMRNEPIRFLLWIVGFSALVGNMFSLIYRFKYDTKRLKLGYGIFVTNLAMSDFLMGVYLFIIAAADVSFRGEYTFFDEWWRTSHWCKTAGVLATMSSEASVLFICFITLDRLIVIKYPFGQIRFKTKSAITVSLAVWIVVTMIASLPLVWTSYFQDEFYSQSGVCLALPLTRKHTDSTGSAYSIAISIGFNFVTFLLIGIGQYLIYKEIKKSSKQAETGGLNRPNDLKVARSLLLVVMTDFLCWFPIGVIGFLSLGGVIIPGEVYSWAAVVILPVNSALNPFLYTFSAIIGKKKAEPTPASATTERTRPAEITIESVTCSDDNITKIYESQERKEN